MDKPINWTLHADTVELENGLPARALDFATDMHRGQLRKDGKRPFISHPVRVMARLKMAGVKDEEVLAAALLHDTVEDTEATHADLQRRFGGVVAGIVKGLTLPEKDQHGNRPPGAKRAAFENLRHFDRRVALIKMADRLDNLQDWRGMDPAYKATYAKEGLFILTSCLQNTRSWEGLEHLHEAWHTLSEDLFNCIGQTLFGGVTVEETPVLEG